jgi:hypothetical protein
LAKRNENVIAILLEPIGLDEEFIEWPLHITIVPWFHGYDEYKLDELLEKISRQRQGFSAKVQQIEKFGANKDVEVNVIDDCPPLYELHNQVFTELEKNGFIIHQKDYVGETYRAHITRQPHGHLDSGQIIKINSFSLIHQKRLKKTGTIVKAVVKNYEFKK